MTFDVSLCHTNGCRPSCFWRDVPFFSQFVLRPVGLANGTANVPFSDLMLMHLVSFISRVARVATLDKKIILKWYRPTHINRSCSGNLICKIAKLWWNCSINFSDILVTRWLLLPSDFTKIQFRPGLHPGPHWGSLQCSPRPLAGGEGAGCPLLKNPASAFGLVLRPFGPQAAALRALHHPVFLWAWGGNPTYNRACPNILLINLMW